MCLWTTGKKKAGTPGEQSAGLARTGPGIHSQSRPTQHAEYESSRINFHPEEETWA